MPLSLQDKAAITAFINKHAWKEQGEEDIDVRKVMTGNLGGTEKSETIVLCQIAGHQHSNHYEQYLAVFVHRHGHLMPITHLSVGGKGIRFVDLVSIDKKLFILIRFCMIMMMLYAVRASIVRHHIFLLERHRGSRRGKEENFGMNNQIYITKIFIIVFFTIFLAPQVYAAKLSSTCYGTTKDGRLENGWQLPSSGNNFEAYSSLGTFLGRNYVHSKVYDVIVAAYKILESTAPDKVFVYGESGWKKGGRFRPHKTHTNGLSADFFLCLLLINQVFP